MGQWLILQCDTNSSVQLIDGIGHLLHNKPAHEFHQHFRLWIIAIGINVFPLEILQTSFKGLMIWKRRVYSRYIESIFLVYTICILHTNALKRKSIEYIARKNENDTRKWKKIEENRRTLRKNGRKRIAYNNNNKKKIWIIGYFLLMVRMVFKNGISIPSFFLDFYRRCTIATISFTSYSVCVCAIFSFIFSS